MDHAHPSIVGTIVGEKNFLSGGLLQSVRDHYNFFFVSSCCIIYLFICVCFEMKHKKLSIGMY